MNIFVPELPEEGLEIEQVLGTDWLDQVVAPDYRSVPQSPGAKVRVRVDRVMGDGEAVMVSGELAADLEFQCGRCLEKTILPVQISVGCTFMERSPSSPSPDADLPGADGEEGAAEGDTCLIKNDEIDLGEMLREQLVLAVPMHPFCTEHCEGLCARCGVNLNREDCGCERVAGNLKWQEALKGIKLPQGSR